MKRSVVALAVLVIVIILGIVGYFYQQNRISADKQNAERTQTTEEPAAKDMSGPTASQPGVYVDYSEDIIANTDGTKILFFHAPWCPQCRSLESSIESTDLPNGLTIIKVDYDSNQELRKKYGVTLQTTFVKVNDEGDLVEKYVAYNEPVFASVKANLID